MGKKILFVATSDIHINTFHKPYLQWLSGQGHEIHLAVENRGGLKIPFVNAFHYMPFPRTPFSIQNIKTYRLLKPLIKKEEYNLVHCHTPLPGVIARLAARKAREKGTKILYTSHGFHFFKGALLFNWFTYFPIEFLLSFLTDGIVTINKEDYELINQKMHHRETYQLKGIGCDPDKFKTIPKNEKLSRRKKLGFSNEDFIVLCVGELNKNKNQIFLIQSLEKLTKEINLLKIIFVGKGFQEKKLRDLTKKLSVENFVHFVGFRDDVEIFASIADVGVSASIREGFGISLAEQMLCKVPVVASENRGHKEIIDHGINGFLFKKMIKKNLLKP
jgi:glycosyltransferase EpsD